ncbi:serine/threonine-protein kinase [Streptomyces cyaneochromogenes]|uniref:serine/threonine-protein kinase n=1 Tax=Streptomyces cyaneochromogenes TaxID=2496836 RepID=UPI00389AA6E7
MWRAVDEVLDRLVAVKEMRIDGLDPEDTRTRRERTLREARATARIDHPNVVRVYDVVDQGERLWIVMELVAGRSLERIMAEEGPLGPRDTARIGLGLVAALRQVHARGVLHRDIKPGNVLVEAEATNGRGRVVLTDFGIAAIQDAKALTMVGMLVGSPDYMAPERVSGRPQGPPSDIWSLGATLSAALAGRSPFSRDTTLATLHAVLYEEPELPPTAGPLHDILTALLNKDPSSRPDLDDLETTLHPVAFPTATPTMPGTGGAGSVSVRGEPRGPEAVRDGAGEAEGGAGAGRWGAGGAGSGSGTGVASESSRAGGGLDGAASEPASGPVSGPAGAPAAEGGPAPGPGGKAEAVREPESNAVPGLVAGAGSGPGLVPGPGPGPGPGLSPGSGPGSGSGSGPGSDLSPGSVQGSVPGSGSGLGSGSGPGPGPDLSPGSVPGSGDPGSGSDPDYGSGPAYDSNPAYPPSPALDPRHAPDLAHAAGPDQEPSPTSAPERATAHAPTPRSLPTPPPPSDSNLAPSTPAPPPPGESPTPALLEAPRVVTPRDPREPEAVHDAIPPQPATTEDVRHPTTETRRDPAPPPTHSSTTPPSTTPPSTTPPPGAPPSSSSTELASEPRSEARSETPTGNSRGPAPGNARGPAAPHRPGVSLSRAEAVTERRPVPEGEFAPGAARSSTPMPPGELPGPPVPAGPRRGRRRTGRIAVAVGVVVAGAVMAIVLATDLGSPGGGEAGSSPPASVASTPSTGPSSTVEGTSRPQSLPPGSRREAGGFAWAPPEGWRRDVKTGSEVHYTSPDAKQELAAKSSLARDDLMDSWQKSEENARQGQQYRKIRLERTTFRGHPAVVWEYTFTLQGAPWHARLLGFTVEGKSYQINTWYQPDIEPEALKTYEKVRDSFTVL